MVLTAVSGLVTGCGHKLPSVADIAGPRSALLKPSLYAPHSASSPDPASTLSLSVVCGTASCTVCLGLFGSLVLLRQPQMSSFLLLPIVQ